MWQPASIVYPDAELLCSAGIRALLVAEGEADVFVGREIPNPRQPRMVIFNRDGGPAVGLIDQPRMRCRVWAPNDLAVNELANLVTALMPRLVDATAALGVTKESGPFDVADESETPQKYLLFSLRTRGAQLT